MLEWAQAELAVFLMGGNSRSYCTHYQGIGLLLFLGLFAWISWGVVRAQADSASVFDSFLDSTDTIPMPYRADLQLQVLETSSALPAADVVRRTKVLLLAIDSDPLSYPLFYGSSVTNTLEQERAAASHFVSLDSLTLRLRALRVLRMAGSQDSISDGLLSFMPRLETVPCSSALVPDVASYYAALGDVLYSRDRRAPQRSMNEIQTIIQSATSPLLLPAIARLLTRSPLDKSDLQLLIVEFETLLRRSAASDREMSFLGQTGELPDTMRGLVERTHDLGINTSEVVESYRTFMVNSLRQERCRDSITNWPALRVELDRIENSDGFAPSVSTLDFKDIVRQPSTAVGAMVNRLPDARATDDLLGTMYKLRNGAGNSSLDAAHRAIWDQLGDGIAAAADGVPVNNGCD